MEIVSFELAKKLKEKGFNYETRDIYERNTLACRYEDVPKPTISQVLKWLREEKELYIEIYMYHNCYLWEIYNTKIYDTDFTQKSEKYSDIEYETYELAALAGIEYVIDNNLI